jgi:hypothetical protein
MDLLPAGTFDLAHLFMEEEHVRRWRAESENAAARLELATMHRNIAHLLSQHEPVASLGLDRERLRLVLGFVSHGDLPRLQREFRDLLAQGGA